MFFYRNLPENLNATRDHKIVKRRVLLLILLSWIVCLIPLTWLGYGSDTDAWRVARVAKIIYSTGQYTRSRTTGFPLFELASAPLVSIGKWYLSNLLPLLSGVAVFLALIRLTERKQLRHPIISLVSLMFLPIIVKNATSTMDYVPALALLIWSYVFLLERKWLLAAVLIGIACGFRPTSGLFVIPATIFTYLETRKPILSFRVFLVAFLCGVIAFSPALLNYGIQDPFGSVKYDFKTRLLITGYNYLQLFGIIQSMVLAACFFVIIRKTIINKNFTPFLLFHISVILAWLTLFIFLSDEVEYLIPAIPSVIFILDRYLSKQTFFYISLLLLSYNVVQLDVLGGHSGHRTLKISLRTGYTIQDIQDRIFKLSTREAADKYVTSTKTVLMFGQPVIPVNNDLWTIKDGMPCQKNGNLYLAKPILDPDTFSRLHAEGFRVVAWREEMWMYSATGTSLPDYVEVIDDLSDFFGVPLRGKALSQK